MKTLKLICVGLLLLSVMPTHAQTNTETARTIPSDPTTHCALRYLYFPNLEAYFDTKKNVYLYNEKGVWKTAEEIPSGYRGYSMYNKVNVSITDYDDDDPIQFLKMHKKKYPYIFNNKQLAHVTASR
ncbi:MAG TPA: hypothetical protein VGB50_06880 [Flavobacterium sp.]|jgi:hypothetical protein